MTQELLGKTAAELMDFLESENLPGEIIAVGIVVILHKDLEDGSESTYLQTMSSEKMYHQKLGLFQSALDVIKNPDDESG